MEKGILLDLKRLYALLTPQFIMESERISTLQKAFPDALEVLTGITFGGNSENFTTSLVVTLLQHGKLRDGTPALWRLLHTLRETMGVQNQVEIDSLKASVFQMAEQGERTAGMIERERQRNRSYRWYMQITATLFCVFALITTFGWFWHQNLRRTYVFRYPPGAGYAQQREKIAGYVRRQNPDLSPQEQNNPDNAQFLYDLQVKGKEEEAWEPDSRRAVQQHMDVSQAAIFGGAILTTMTLAVLTLLLIRLYRS